MKKIYLVIRKRGRERDIIHMGFESEKDAEDFANELKNKTGWDCYEVQKLNFQPTKQVTIQELIDKGELPE